MSNRISNLMMADKFYFLTNGCAKPFYNGGQHFADSVAIDFLRSTRRRGSQGLRKINIISGVGYPAPEFLLKMGNCPPFVLRFLIYTG